MRAKADRRSWREVALIYLTESVYSQNVFKEMMSVGIFV